MICGDCHYVCDTTNFKIGFRINSVFPSVLDSKPDQSKERINASQDIQRTDRVPVS